MDTPTTNEPFDLKHEFMEFWLRHHQTPIFNGMGTKLLIDLRYKDQRPNLTVAGVIELMNHLRFDLTYPNEISIIGLTVCGFPVDEIEFNFVGREVNVKLVSPAVRNAAVRNVCLEMEDDFAALNQTDVDFNVFFSMLNQERMF